MTGPLAGADGDLGASTINVKDIDGGPLGSATRDLGLSTINANNFDGGPPGGGVRDPGVPTINTKNIEGEPPSPRGGGGVSRHSGYEECVVNLHGYDRQRVILLMGPALLRLVLLWLTTLSRLTGHG
jgi:hypothetical protein